MTFEFLTAARILFGPGTYVQTGFIITSLGERPFVITGKTMERYQPLLDELEGRGLDVGHGVVTREPTTTLVHSLVEEVRQLQCDVIVGFGGGSVLDTAKAVAGLSPNPGEIFDYLEVIGQGHPLQVPALPCVAIPTTAGTGAEVTKNAVLSSPGDQVKVSLRSPLLLPRVAIVDPELTHSMPRKITAYSGLDALTQVIEPFLSSRHNPLVDSLCRNAIGLGGKALMGAMAEGSDPRAREDMSLVSLTGGMALTNAGLGAVHGFAGPLGGMTGAPHGGICACLLAPVFAANVRSLEVRGDPDRLLPRFDEVGRLLTGESAAGRKQAVEWLWECRHSLEIPTLRDLGLEPERFPEAIEKARRASSMKANAVVLEPDELMAILEKASKHR
ncbi:MAG: iron-containing alcohol dehydrogenase [Acidobacteriota bacterium]